MAAVEPYDEEIGANLLPFPDDDHQSDTADLPSDHQDYHHHLQSIASPLLIRQLRSQGLSFQLWPAATSFVALLDTNSTLLLRPTAHPLRILELGSGTGLVGIAAAAILGARVTLTDLPHVLPNLKFNADANAEVVAYRGGAVEVGRLRWGDLGDAEAIGGAEGFDVVVASDVVYYEDLVEPLLATLRWFVRGEVVFVMAHLRRWKRTDAAFFRKARKVFDVEVVHRDTPAMGCRIGVAVYRFTAKSKTKY